MSWNTENWSGFRIMSDFYLHNGTHRVFCLTIHKKDCELDVLATRPDFSDGATRDPSYGLIQWNLQSYTNTVPSQIKFDTT